MKILNHYLFKNYTWQQEACGSPKGYRWVYVYTGTWKRWDLNPQKLIFRKISYLLLTVLLCLLYFRGSVLSCKAAHVKSVGFLGLSALAALLFLLSAMLPFLISKNKLTESGILLQKYFITGSALLIGLSLLVSNLVAVTVLGMKGMEDSWEMFFSYAGAGGLALLLAGWHSRLRVTDIQASKTKIR